MKEENKRKVRIAGTKNAPVAERRSVVMSMRLPQNVRDNLESLAESNGISMTEQVIRSLDASSKFDKAIDAVSKYLKDNPPPFVDDGWMPSRSECITFILKAVDDAIKKES